MNKRIQKFTPDGRFVSKWGGVAHGDGIVNLPAGIAIDSNGFVYVANVYEILKLSSEGQFVNEWGSYGPGIGQ